MKFLLYLLSGLFAVVVGYFINQLPNLPDYLKPWVPAAIAVLIVVSAIVMIQQEKGNSTSARTVIKGNHLQGKDSKINANDAVVERNRLQGEGSSISTNDRLSEQKPEQNP
jgi:hypothetical protein